MVTQTQATSGPHDFNWFSDNGIFMPMINDTNRNVFYKAVIERATPGKIVCDIGCGSGFLSILAARAGATKVYAIEMDPGRAAFARDVVARVGYSDIIEVINADFLTLDIKADVYVSETIGAQIYNENIINIAEHARQHGGVFIPSQIDMWVEVYEHHPIFPMTFTRSEAFEFQPDIAIDDTFENHINTEFQNKHPLNDTLYRANTTRDLFQMLPRFEDLRLTKLYTTPEITIDFNQQVNTDDLHLTVPYTVSADEITCVLFWRARYQDIVMESVDCWWAHVSKCVLPRIRKPHTDIVFSYMPDKDDWRVTF